MSETLVDKIDGIVEDGRYASRSECIETCVKQVFKMEESDSRFTDLIVELMELAAKSPEFVEMYKKALKNV
jgi:Arc/MetJ-type ribon-helix-helix transcriptional regulator